MDIRDAAPVPATDTLDAERARARRLTLWLVGGVALLQLAVAWRAGLGTDEAHYALYGFHLDWSYFDHPPLAGWLQALVLRVSDSEFALRVIPIAAFATTSLLLLRLARRLFPDESPWLGCVALLLVHGGIMFQLMGMSMLPEVPLLLLGVACVSLLVELREQPDGLRNWLLLGLVMGLAGLSKYTAVTLVLSAPLVLLPAHGLRLLTRAGPWIAVTLAALLVSPVVLWNQAHDWISFAYQLDHGTGGESWKLSRVLSTQAAQLLGYGPAFYLFGLAALWSARLDVREPGTQITLAVALPVLLLFGSTSGLEVGLPHWTSLAWLTLAPLTARWILRRWARRGVRRVVWGSATLSALLALLVYSQLAFWWVPFPDYKDPSAALRGWDAAAARALELRDAMAREPGPPPRLFVDSWARASRLAWYARPQPVLPLDGRRDQFDLWFGDVEPGDRGILVIWDRKGEGTDDSRDLKKFAQHELVAEQHVDIAGHRAATFAFYACRDFRSAP